jgi:sugar/nucleoside kinase (ribokinase family)
VVGLGLCCVDHLYRVDSLDLHAPRIRYRERLVSLGGMVANALVQASAEGAHTEALSTVGDDPDGRLVRRALRRGGIGTRGVVRVEGGATRIAVVLVDAQSGERRFVIADRAPFNRDAPDLPLAAIRRGSVLLLDGHYAAQARRALARAREVGATVVADWNRPIPELLELLPLVDHPVVPLEFVDEYSAGDPHQTLRRLRELARGEPVVTLGERGALYFEGRRIRRHPARKVRVVDSTGAGDAFHGAFGAALAQGEGLPGAIERGTRAGALCCTAPGATGHLLPVEERAFDARWSRPD